MNIDIRHILSVALAILVGSASAFSQHHITFMPQWTPQAQFAGYYVALEMGFYTEAGLDVTIKHLSSNSNQNCMEHLEKGDVDIVTNMLIGGMKERSKGFPIVNVLQTSQNTGLCCVAHKPVKSLEDLNGMKIGRWESGFAENATIAQNELGLDIHWVPYIYGVTLYIANAVDAALFYSYNELIQLYLSMGEVPADHIIFFNEYGYNYPEDGLFVTEAFYKANKDDVDKFVKASKKGWDYCRTHKKEALAIVRKYTTGHHIRTNDVHQEMMLRVVLTLQEDKNTHEATYAPVSKQLFDDMCRKGIEAGILSGKVEYSDFIVAK